MALNSLENLITLHDVALSDHSDTVNAIWCADNLGVVKIINSSNPLEDLPDCCARSGCQKISFPTVRLDDYLPRSVAVYLAKIDVEGHESQVIKGAMELFQDRCRRPVYAFIEFHGSVSQECEEFLNVLFDLGYDVYANHNFRVDYPLYRVNPLKQREFLGLLERGRMSDKWEVDLFLALPTAPILIS